jgi:hypothetical protein
MKIHHVDEFKFEAFYLEMNKVLKLFGKSIKFKTLIQFSDEVYAFVEKNS